MKTLVGTLITSAAVAGVLPPMTPE